MSAPSLIPLSHRDQWEEALAAVPHGFHHTWEFAHASWLTRGYDTYLYAPTAGEERCVCAFIERPVDDYVDVATVSGLSGFAGSAPWSVIEPEWSALVAERGYVSGYIGMNPLFEPAGLPEDAWSHNDIYTLALEHGPDALVESSDRGRRRELRGWGDRARVLVTDREAITRFLLEHYEPFMKRVGATPPYLSAASLEFLSKSDRCLLVGAETEGALEAVYVFGATPYCADCFLAVSIGEGRRHLTDLLWYGVTEYAARGVPTINLGGGAKRDDAIARSKQRFRPERRELRALRQVYARDTYDELCGGGRVRASEGWFPAYRTPDDEVVQEPS